MLKGLFSAGAVIFCCALALAALAAGCGSEPLADYREHVGEINLESADLLKEAAHLLEEGGHDAGENAGGSRVSLEELIEELRAAALELSRVKVPEGMEGFQEDLLALYGGLVSALEGLASLEHGGAEEGESAHGEGEPEHGEEEGGAVEEGPSRGEEPTREGEGGHEEEAPAEHAGEAGTGADPHAGAGH